MDWEIGFSRRAEKYLSQRHLPDDFAIEPVLRALQKIRGETVAVDLKRLLGKWNGFFRVRMGKVRIIFSIDTVAHHVFIEVIDNRGSVYR